MSEVVEATVGFNDYWNIKHDPKASIHSLESRLRYRYDQKLSKKKKTYTQAELSAWLTRLERGVLLYQFCTLTELRQFIFARGIRVTPRMASSKGKLIAALDKADANATFTRLFDLPAELRAMIFVKYFDTLSRPLTAPAPPPIALASKELYKEVMPLFYKNNSFAVEVECDPMEEAFFSHEEDDVYSEPGFYGDLEKRTHILEEQVKWLNTVKPENFAAMGSFCVEFPTCCAMLKVWWNPKTENIGFCTGHSERSGGNCDFCEGYLEHRLHAFFHNIPRGTRISKELIHRFVIVLDDILITAISQYDDMM